MASFREGSLIAAIFLSPIFQLGVSRAGGWYSQVNNETVHWRGHLVHSTLVAMLRLFQWNRKQKPSTGLGIEQQHLLILADLVSELHMLPKVLSIFKTAPGKSPLGSQALRIRKQRDRIREGSLPIIHILEQG
jgi:hypothetical protein